MIMIPVVFSTDHGFVMPTGVAILSMLKHSQDCNCHIYILHDTSVTQEDVRLLRESVIGEGNIISFISLGDAFKGKYEARGVTHVAYFRLLIPWILSDIDKLIYCDGDVVFKGSIKKLFDESIGDNYGAGVKRFQFDGYSYRKYAKKLGLSPMDYINSGVMIINCKKMRDDNLRDKFELQSHYKYRYFDQDIINIVCKGKISSIPYEYNVMPTMDIVEEDIIIIHYAGLKPWLYFTRRWYEWWSIYKESSFFDKDLEKRIVERPFSIKQSMKIWVKWHYPRLYRILRYFLGEMPA